MQQEFVSDLKQDMKNNHLSVHIVEQWGPVEKAKSSKVAPSLETPEEMKSGHFQAIKAGFVADAFVALKKQPEGKHEYMYKITDCNDTDMDLVSFTAIPGDPKAKSLNLTHEKLILDWKVIKGPKFHELQLEGDSNPMDNESWLDQMHVGAVSMALYQLSRDYNLRDKEVVYCTQEPFSVHAVQDCKKGALVFVPQSTRIDTKPVARSIAAVLSHNGTDRTLHIQPLTNVPKPEMKGKPWIAPFWLLRPAAEPTTANMSIVYRTVEVDEYKIQIPCFTNNKAVASFAELQYDSDAYKKAAPTPPASKKRKAKD